MQNSNVFPENATPVSNSNNEALVQAAQAVVNAAKDKKPEGDKSKGKKPKRAAEMSRIACFNEITRTAHRTFVKNTPRKICSLLREDQLVQLKRDAISEAIVKYQAKHGGDYDLKAYKKDLAKRVYLLIHNPIFKKWAASNGVGFISTRAEVAQHIVFNGAEFFERVMMNDYLEHGELQIGWHRDYPFGIFPLEELGWDLKTESFNFKKPEDQKPEDQKDNAPNAPKADVKQKDDAA